MGTEVMTFITLVLALEPLQKFPLTFNLYVFQWKCPLQNENGLALSKTKFQVCPQTLNFTLEGAWWFSSGSGNSMRKIWVCIELLQRTPQQNHRACSLRHVSCIWISCSVVAGHSSLALAHLTVMTSFRCRFLLNTIQLGMPSSTGSLMKSTHQ